MTVDDARRRAAAIVAADHISSKLTVADCDLLLGEIVQAIIDAYNEGLDSVSLGGSNILAEPVKQTTGNDA